MKQFNHHFIKNNIVFWKGKPNYLITGNILEVDEGDVIRQEGGNLKFKHEGRVARGVCIPGYANGVRYLVKEIRLLP